MRIKSEDELVGCVLIIQEKKMSDERSLRDIRVTKLMKANELMFGGKSKSVMFWRVIEFGGLLLKEQKSQRK